MDIPTPPPVGRRTAALAELVQDWPEVLELRRAASARARASFVMAVAAVVAEARVALGRLWMEHASRTRVGEPAVADLAQPGSAEQGACTSYDRCCRLRGAAQDGAMEAWLWDARQSEHLIASLVSVVGDGTGRAGAPGALDADSKGPATLEHTLPEAQGPPGLQCVYFMAVASGWPPSSAVRLLSGTGAGRFSKCGRQYTVTASITSRDGTGRWWPVSFPNEPHAYLILVQAERAAVIYGWTDMRPREVLTDGLTPVLSKRGGKPFFSRFLPDYIRLPCDAAGVIQYPRYGAAPVVEAEEAWHRLLGPLDRTTRAIVGGRLVIPRHAWPDRPLLLANRASWEANEQAQRALGPEIAKYIHRGVFQYVPPGSPAPPIIVSPLSVVDKNSDPWFRLVQDARESNEGVSPWPVRYQSISDLGVLLDYADFVFIEDLRTSYHNTNVPGCHGKRRWVSIIEQRPDGQGLVARHRLEVGCYYTDCLSGCDRSMAGVRLGGHTFRVCCAHFGQRVAGSTLASLVNSFRRGMLRRRADAGPPPRPGMARGSIPSVAWVDDVAYVAKVPLHGICGGLAAGCEVCHRIWVEANGSQAHVRSTSEQLHLELTDKKRQCPSQRVQYTGIIVDTIVGRMFCPDEKRVALLALLAEIGLATSVGARTLAKCRGKILHYSQCLPYIRASAVWFSQVLGSEQDPDWDRQVTLPGDAAAVLAKVASTIVQSHHLGQPLWPYIASSLYAARLLGLTGGRLLVLNEWDASVHGWGGFVSWGSERRLVAAAFLDTEDMQVQARRETMGGYLLFKASSRMLDTRGALFLHRNDCIAALAALRKGSFASASLQRIAAAFNELSAAQQTEHYFLHAPGTSLVADGIDDASRGVAQRTMHPACTETMRGILRSMAAALGWEITVDIFATEANAITERFYSHYAEPNAEAVDALAVTSWDVSLCARCGALHREVVLAFPPAALINRMVRKLAADGARGLVVVPLALTGAHWPRLLGAAVPLPGQSIGTPYRRFKNLRGLIQGSEEHHAGELAVFAVDFGAPGPPGAGGLRDTGCPGMRERRLRNPQGSASDRRDRTDIRAALEEELRRAVAGGATLATLESDEPLQGLDA